MEFLLLNSDLGSHYFELIDILDLGNGEAWLCRVTRRQIGGEGLVAGTLAFQLFGIVNQMHYLVRDGCTMTGRLVIPYADAIKNEQLLKKYGCVTKFPDQSISIERTEIVSDAYSGAKGGRSFSDFQIEVLERWMQIPRLRI